MFTQSITTEKGTMIKIGVKNKTVIGHTKIGTIINEMGYMCHHKIVIHELVV